MTGRTEKVSPLFLTPSGPSANGMGFGMAKAHSFSGHALTDTPRSAL